MGLRFRKSKKVAPGVRLFLGKNGVSTSFGRRGTSINIGKKGTFLNIGIPETGLSFRQRIESKGTKKSLQSNSDNLSTNQVNQCGNQQKARISIWSSIKYIIGFISIYIVYNWTIIFCKSNDWPKVALIFYVLLFLIIISVFYKPVIGLFKSITGAKMTNNNVQKTAKTRVNEITKEEGEKVFSQIITKISDQDSSDDNLHV